MAAALGTSSASASTAEYNGISADGKIAIFSTTEALVSGDTDPEQRDVYERAYDATLERYVTREVSIGPIGGNDTLPAQYDALSADGDAVYFSTKEPLVAGDTDHRTDIYRNELGTNTTTLISQGEASCAEKGCGNGAFDASFVPRGLAQDGEELFFVTDEKLSPLDTDGSFDLYMRDIGAGTTLLISQAAPDCVPAGAASCGNGAFGVSFHASAADGSMVVFSSSEQLAEADGDTLQDVYVRNITTETTRLVSTPGFGGCPEAVDCKAVYGGMATDGSHVFFESSEPISLADTDESQDVYDWSSSAGATLASIGPAGGNEPKKNATYAGNSSDGSAVFFHTSEKLDSADTDGLQDVYERDGSTTTLISTGPLDGSSPSASASLDWVSPDGSGSGVLFTTAQKLVPLDLDNSADLYQRDGGVTTLVSSGGSTGPGASFAGASNDGSHLFFLTSEALAEEDKDVGPDIYELAGSTTSLISTGPEAGTATSNPGFRGVSTDGAHVFFTTEERLTEGDPDAETDVYDRFHEVSGSTTRLVSVGNLLPLGPVTPTLTKTNPVSPGISTSPAIIGQAEPETWIKIYKTSNCSGQPVAQGTSTQLGSGGITVSVSTGSTTSFRATAEADGLPSPCSASITYKQETPPPPPPPPPSEESGSGGTGTSGGSSTTSTGSKGTGGSKGGQGITYVTPETLITFGPASKTRKKKVLFQFSDSTGQPGSTFLCKLDHRRWKGCSSPIRLAKLRLGRHVFSVKAVNALGTADDLPAKRRFKVVR